MKKKVLNQPALINGSSWEFLAGLLWSGSVNLDHAISEEKKKTFAAQALDKLRGSALI